MSSKHTPIECGRGSHLKKSSNARRRRILCGSLQAAPLFLSFDSSSICAGQRQGIEDVVVESRPTVIVLGGFAEVVGSPKDGPGLLRRRETSSQGDLDSSDDECIFASATFHPSRRVVMKVIWRLERIYTYLVLEGRLNPSSIRLVIT